MYRYFSWKALYCLQEIHLFVRPWVRPWCGCVKYILYYVKLHEEKIDMKDKRAVGFFHGYKITLIKSCHLKQLRVPRIKVTIHEPLTSISLCKIPSTVYINEINNTNMFCFFCFYIFYKIGGSMPSYNESQLWLNFRIHVRACPGSQTVQGVATDCSVFLYTARVQIAPSM